MYTAHSPAPPTPWSRELTEPTLDPSAFIHTFSNLIGDVRIGANVLVAPGVSIRADEGHPFYIGAGSNLQDGVVVHGLEQGRVVGDDQQRYSVWIGNNSSITHMALIHGPAYVGDDCFIGFRSTVFNARIGKGCIVMLHALIQDVEIPPGRFVASGSLITNQAEADRLPSVKDVDIKFARHVISINDALRAGYHCAENLACIAPIRSEIAGQQTLEVEILTQAKQEGVMSATITQQVEQLLRQGYRVGMEYADERRFRTSSWYSVPTVQSSRAQDVLAALVACLSEHPTDYVRLIGIDPNNKRRVLEEIIQRPGTPAMVSTAPASFSASSHSAPASSGLASRIQQLLAQGYRVGLEYADERRFRTSSWYSVPTIQSSHAPEVLRAVERCLAEHTGEFVRLIGIDPKDKRRVLEEMIHRPGAPVVLQASTASSSSHAPAGIHGQVVKLLTQGYRVGLEYADERRFRTSSWYSVPTVQSNNPQDAMRVITGCLAEHPNDYVRLIGIDPNNKRRVLEEIIQRPGSPAVMNGSPTTVNHQAPAASSSYRTPTSLPAEVVDQVRKLLAQGFKVGTEHADRRRFQTSSWTSCAPLPTREAEVFAALETCLADHAGEYVRLIGIDPKDKRRVLETTIQRP